MVEKSITFVVFFGVVTKSVHYSQRQTSWILFAAAVHGPDVANWSGVIGGFLQKLQFSKISRMGISTDLYGKM